MKSSSESLKQGTSLKVKLAILTVFVGCSLNVIFLELLVKSDPGCGNLVTFLSFLFISIEGFVFTSDFGRKTPKVPLKAYTTVSLVQKQLFSPRIPLYRFKSQPVPYNHHKFLF